MSGRGDNNKNGTSGQGASNQSNQPIGGKEDHPKSNHGAQTGGSPSEEQEKTQDQNANRNSIVEKD